LETIIRRSDGIVRNLLERVPLLLEFTNDEFTMHDGLEYETDEVLSHCKNLIKDAWKIRNTYTHGQKLDELHFDKLVETLSEWPSLLYWVNRGIIFLNRIPSNEEFEGAINSGSLEWDIPVKWNLRQPEESALDAWLYRIDGTYNPQKIDHYTSIGGQEQMSYLEFLEKFDVSGASK